MLFSFVVSLFIIIGVTGREYGTGSCRVQFWHTQAGCEAQDDTVARESFRFDPQTLGECQHRPGGVDFKASDMSSLMMFEGDTPEPHDNMMPCTGTLIGTIKMSIDTCLMMHKENFHLSRGKHLVHPWSRLSCDS